MTNPYFVRSAATPDVDTLADFNCRLAVETEDKQLDLQTVRQGVARGLQQADEVNYYVAELDATIVGALMLTREWSDWRDGWMVWLQSVYVRQEHRGQGVFQRLLDHVINEMRGRRDVVGLRLYVESENGRAQSAYRKAGFVTCDYQVMEMTFARAGAGS